MRQLHCFLAHKILLLAKKLWKWGPNENFLDKIWVGIMPQKLVFDAKNEIIPNQTILWEKINNKPWLDLVLKVAKHHIYVQYKLWFFWELNNMPILGKMFVPYCTMKSQQIQHFTMVHCRDILLAESRGNSRFLTK